MATSVTIRTPKPSTQQVAKSLGVPQKRVAEIEKLANSAVASYYLKQGRGTVASSAAPARKKRAA